MFILGIVLMGALAATRLPVDRLPNINIPFVSVNVNYQGASSEDVEQQVLVPIEDAMSGVPGAATIRSSAREGSGNVNVQFVEGTDLNAALLDVQRRVASIRNQLPKDINDPRVNKFDPNASPIMNLALTGPDQEQTFSFAEDVVQPKLLSLPGVADVNIQGGLKRQIQVLVDPAKLGAYNLPVDAVNNALTRENLSAPAGQLDRGASSLPVRSLGLFQKADDLNSLVIGQANGSPVYLRNVATIVETYADRTNYLRLNGDDAVGLSIIKQGDANTLAVADSVRAAIASLQPSLPAGSKLQVVNDSSRFVRRSLDAVQFDLGLAVFLTATVLLLFLHSWRNTAIVLLAIPTSLIATFLVMYALGFTINLMTLMALAMTIGILVDDSIVVLENIHRHLSQGSGAMDAALTGRSEIGLAALAITFTDIVVYLPVAFMQGNVGQLFRQYGLTIAAATFFSMLVSFTLTPMLASRILKGGHEGEGRVSRNPLVRFGDWFEAAFDAVARGYARVQGRVLRLRWVVLGLAGLLMAASVSVIPMNLVSTEYAPQEDDGQFQLSLTLPVGTALTVTDDVTRQMEGLLGDVHEITNVYVNANGNGANFTIETEEKSKRSKSLDDIMGEVRKLATLLPDTRARTSVSNPLSGGSNSIGIDILGDDLPTLTQVGDQLVEVAQTVPGITSAQNSSQQQQPELQISVDRDRAAAAGVSTSQISSTLRTMIQGTTVSQLRPEGQVATDIIVKSVAGKQTTLGNLGSVPVTTTRGQGTVPLSQVTRQRTGRAPVQISRVDRKRSVQVSAQVGGRPVGDVARDLRVALNSQVLPPGYRWDVRGSVQQLDAALAALSTALAISALLVYMTLIALYESFFYPLAIMFALPLSGVGAITGLLVTHNTINIFSMIGMIALMGLTAKNGILLVDYTNTLRARGMRRAEALQEAGRTRLRPIIMTSSTVVAAMMPLAFKLEAGGESRAPMAVVIIGGVISSTLLTLFVVPVMYTLLDDVQSHLRIPSFRWPWHRATADVAGGTAGAYVPSGPAPAYATVPVADTMHVQHHDSAMATGHRDALPTAQLDQPLGGTKHASPPNGPLMSPPLGAAPALPGTYEAMTEPLTSEHGG